MSQKEKIEIATASVTLGGTEYILPFDGYKILNTTGRVIPEGTLIYVTNEPAGSSKSLSNQ